MNDQIEKSKLRDRFLGIIESHPGLKEELPAIIAQCIQAYRENEKIGRPLMSNEEAAAFLDKFEIEVEKDLGH
jgi:hypothetical protein